MMKSCPKCDLNYSDETLEFCLEDGSRLVFLKTSETEQPTVTLPNKFNPVPPPPTTDLPFSNQNRDLQSVATAQSLNAPEKGVLKEKIIRQGNQVLEVSPIIISLAHNWWQWIYLNSQNYNSFSNYVFSANFLVWILLLIVGVVVGLFSVKRTQNRGFAFAGLVILSVNLILFLVPKR